MADETPQQGETIYGLGLDIRDYMAELQRALEAYNVFATQFSKTLSVSIDASSLKTLNTSIGAQMRQAMGLIKGATKETAEQSVKEAQRVANEYGKLAGYGRKAFVSLRQESKTATDGMVKDAQSAAQRTGQAMEATADATGKAFRKTVNEAKQGLGEVSAVANAVNAQADAASKGRGDQADREAAKIRKHLEASAKRAGTTPEYLASRAKLNLNEPPDILKPIGGDKFAVDAGKVRDRLDDIKAAMTLVQGEANKTGQAMDRLDAKYERYGANYDRLALRTGALGPQSQAAIIGRMNAHQARIFAETGNERSNEGAQGPISQLNRLEDLNRLVDTPEGEKKDVFRARMYALWTREIQAEEQALRAIEKRAREEEKAAAAVQAQLQKEYDVREKAHGQALVYLAKEKQDTAIDQYQANQLRARERAAADKAQGTANAMLEKERAPLEDKYFKAPFSSALEQRTNQAALSKLDADRKIADDRFAAWVNGLDRQVAQAGHEFDQSARPRLTGVSTKPGVGTNYYNQAPLAPFTQASAPGGTGFGAGGKFYGPVAPPPGFTPPVPPQGGGIGPGGRYYGPVLPPKPPAPPPTPPTPPGPKPPNYGPALGQAKELKKTQDGIGLSLLETARRMGTWLFFYKAVHEITNLVQRSITGFIGSGIEYTKQLETQQLALRGILAENFKITDQQGEQLTGIAALTALQVTSKNQWREIQQASLSVVGTTSDLMGLYSGILPFASNLGAGLQQIQDLTKSTAVAASLLDVSFQDARSALVALLQGRSLTRNRLVGALGFSKEEIASLKGTPALFDAVSARMDAFLALSDEASHTFAALSESFKDFTGIIASGFTTPITDLFKEFIISLTDANSEFSLFKKTASGVGLELQPGLQAFITFTQAAFKQLMGSFKEWAAAFARMSSGDIQQWVVGIQAGAEAIIFLAKSMVGGAVAVANFIAVNRELIKWLGYLTAALIVKDAFTKFLRAVDNATTAGRAFRTVWALVTGNLGETQNALTGVTSKVTRLGAVGTIAGAALKTALTGLAVGGVLLAIEEIISRLARTRQIALSTKEAMRALGEGDTAGAIVKLQDPLKSNNIGQRLGTAFRLFQLADKKEKDVNSYFGGNTSNANIAKVGIKQTSDLIAVDTQIEALTKDAAKARTDFQNALKKSLTTTGDSDPRVNKLVEELGVATTSIETYTARIDAATGKVPTNPYDDIIKRESAKQGVDADLIRSIIKRESAFNPKAVSSKGAQGLMQLEPGTAQQYGVKDAFDPEQNIKAGVKYFRDQLEKFGQNIDLALAAYNAGPAAVKKYDNKVPPYKETQQYVASIKADFRARQERAITATTPEGVANDAEALARVVQEKAAIEKQIASIRKQLASKEGDVASQEASRLEVELHKREADLAKKVAEKAALQASESKYTKDVEDFNLVAAQKAAAETALIDSVRESVSSYTSYIPGSVDNAIAGLDARSQAIGKREPVSATAAKQIFDLLRASGDLGKNEQTGDQAHDDQVARELEAGLVPILVSAIEQVRKENQPTSLANIFTKVLKRFDAIKAANDKIRSDQAKLGIARDIHLEPTPLEPVDKEIPDYAPLAPAKIQARESADAIVLATLRRDVAARITTQEEADAKERDLLDASAEYAKKVRDEDLTNYAAYVKKKFDQARAFPDKYQEVSQQDQERAYTQFAADREKADADAKKREIDNETDRLNKVRNFNEELEKGGIQLSKKLSDVFGVVEDTALASFDLSVKEIKERLKDLGFGPEQQRQIAAFSDKAAQARPEIAITSRAEGQLKISEKFLSTLREQQGLLVKQLEAGEISVERYLNRIKEIRDAQADTLQIQIQAYETLARQGEKGLVGETDPEKIAAITVAIAQFRSQAEASRQELTEILSIVARIATAFSAFGNATSKVREFLSAFDGLDGTNTAIEKMVDGLRTTLDMLDKIMSSAKAFSEIGGAIKAVVGFTKDVFSGGKSSPAGLAQQGGGLLSNIFSRSKPASGSAVAGYAQQAGIFASLFGGNGSHGTAGTTALGNYFRLPPIPQFRVTDTAAPSQQLFSLAPGAAQSIGTLATTAGSSTAAAGATTAAATTGAATAAAVTGVGIAVSAAIVIAVALFNKAVKKAEKDITDSFKTISKAYDSGTITLGDALRESDKKRQELVAKYSSSKSGRKALKELLPQIDDQIDAMKKQAEQIQKQFGDAFREMFGLRPEEILNDTVLKPLKSGPFKDFTLSLFNLEKQIKEYLASFDTSTRAGMDQYTQALDNVRKYTSAFFENAKDQFESDMQGFEGEALGAQERLFGLLNEHDGLIKQLRDVSEQRTTLEESIQDEAERRAKAQDKLNELAEKELAIRKQIADVLKQANEDELAIRRRGVLEAQLTVAQQKAIDISKVRTDAQDKIDELNKQLAGLSSDKEDETKANARKDRDFAIQQRNLNEREEEIRKAMRLNEIRTVGAERVANIEGEMFGMAHDEFDLAVMQNDLAVKQAEAQVKKWKETAALIDSIKASAEGFFFEPPPGFPQIKVDLGTIHIDNRDYSNNNFADPYPNNGRVDLPRDPNNPNGPLHPGDSGGGSSDPTTIGNQARQSGYGDLS